MTESIVVLIVFSALAVLLGGILIVVFAVTILYLHDLAYAIGAGLLPFVEKVEYMLVDLAAKMLPKRGG